MTGFSWPYMAAVLHFCPDLALVNIEDIRRRQVLTELVQGTDHLFSIFPMWNAYVRVLVIVSYSCRIFEGEQGLAIRFLWELCLSYKTPFQKGSIPRVGRQFWSWYISRSLASSEAVSDGFYISLSLTAYHG